MGMTKRTCATCAYDGCCVDLHYCGGNCWKPAEDEDGEGVEHDPSEDWPDPYDQWLHDSDAWQDRNW